MASCQLCILIIVCWMSDYEMSNAVALETNNLACSCSTGCNFTQSCIPTDNCRKENVALGKPANISSTYSDTQGPAGPACLAVNGNTSMMYVPDTQGGHPNCIHTAMNDSNAWWEVDLGRIYTITDITVYTYISLTYMMDDVIITIDGRECYIFPPKTKYTPLVRNISCISPVQGRIVRFSRNMTDSYLIFCEVQVWACKPGLYGQDCNSECNCLNNDTCDNYYGSCTAGCSSGYYGFNCTQKCGRCKDMECNSTTGYCLAGCQTGWKQSMCNECSDGYYGINCSQACGKCKAGRSCNSTNGQCLTGCETGWKEPMCTGCLSGYYGFNCTQKCGRCKDIECNSTTGYCLAGCQTGWKQPMCNECSDGHYGINCNQACGKCKAGRSCNSTNGQCLTGCETGWKEPMCTVLLQQTNDHDLTGVIAGSVVGAGLLIGGAIVTAVLIWLTLKDKRRPQPLLEDKETQDDLGMENLNFYENAYGKLETHEDVARPYENLGK